MAPDPRKFMNGPFSLSARNIKCLAFGFSGVASPLVNGPHGIYGWPLQNLWVAPKTQKNGWNLTVQKKSDPARLTIL